MSSYFAHPNNSGLGLDMSDLLSHIRKMEKIEDKQEKVMAAPMSEMFALQSASVQAQQQGVLQSDELERRSETTAQLMDYLPYALGGLGALVGIVLIIRARRRR